jgi:hypothetical protein
MKTVSNFPVVAVICIAFIGCGRTNESVIEASNLQLVQVGSTEVEKLQLGQIKAEYVFKNLQLYPIVANEAFINNRKQMGTYLSLNEAMTQQKVSVTEHSSARNTSADSQEQRRREGDAIVNTLFIENTSADTVLILNGEMVKGGNQDRVIAQDIVLLPHSGKIDLSVFCVEQGRWSDSDAFYCDTHTMTPTKVRKAALVSNEQEVVWDKVSEKLQELNIPSETFAVADIKLNEDYNTLLNAYLNQLKNIFAGQQNVIGVIAVAGSEIIGCDLFATNQLFVKHYPNLLQSYASDALPVKTITITPKMVDEYLQRIVREKAEPEDFIFTKGAAGKTHYKAHFTSF